MDYSALSLSHCFSLMKNSIYLKIWSAIKIIAIFSHPFSENYFPCATFIHTTCLGLSQISYLPLFRLSSIYLRYKGANWQFQLKASVLKVDFQIKMQVISVWYIGATPSSWLFRLGHNTKLIPNKYIFLPFLECPPTIQTMFTLTFL